MTKQTPPKLEELLREFDEMFIYPFEDGTRNANWSLDQEKSIKAFIKKVYEAGYFQGIKDEIECVETSGEHLDLQERMKITNS